MEELKYPIGIQSFEDIRKNGFVYVDKTAMVYDLVKKGFIYFLSRPPKFGKSLLISTLENYFLGKKELFRGLAMESLEKDWIAYPVFRWSFGDTDFSEIRSLDSFIDKQLSEWENTYGVKESVDDFGWRFKEILSKAHKQTGRRCVVLVDDCYKPVIDVVASGRMVEVYGEEKTLQNKYFTQLSTLYTVFKSYQSHLQFIFLTSDVHFLPNSPFGGFNNYDNISLTYYAETLCGITQAELENYFAKAIKDFAVELGISEDEMKAQLHAKYGGYHFSTDLHEVYNPYSLMNAFANKRMDNYWANLGAPHCLERLLADKNKACFHGEPVNDYGFPSFADYDVDNDKAIPMLYQSGYLTIKGYDKQWRQYTLDIPNEEVRVGLMENLLPNYVQSES